MLRMKISLVLWFACKREWERRRKRVGIGAYRWIRTSPDGFVRTAAIHFASSVSILTPTSTSMILLVLVSSLLLS